MDQSIRMAQVIQKLVTQAASLVRSWNETSDIQKLDRNRTSSFATTPIVRSAPITDIEPFAGTFYLQVTNGSLRVDCREPLKGNGQVDLLETAAGRCLVLN